MQWKGGGRGGRGFLISRLSPGPGCCRRDLCRIPRIKSLRTNRRRRRRRRRFRRCTFRRTEIMKSETQGTYCRSSPSRIACRVVPDGGPGGVPRARRLAKVRMMYRVATIMASPSAHCDFLRIRLAIAPLNADKYPRPREVAPGVRLLSISALLSLSLSVLSSLYKRTLGMLCDEAR